MHRMAKYDLIKEIYHSDRTIIYRGKSLEKQESVIIKTLKSECPTLDEITLLENEYQIAKNLDLEGIVKPLSLENYGNGLALILEDVEGQSLQDYIRYKKIDLIDFLKIAIQLAKTLTELHMRQIIHKNLKSSNIIINPQTGQVKITDFAIASRFLEETSSVSNSKILTDTLTYISPEQTGKMNKSIDYRTDYYSLGVTFYEVLTNQLPFPSKAVLPHLVNSEIPAAISEIVMKLLAKNVEDRYQSALGIKYDLEFCLTQLQATGNILNFTVGAQDLYGQLLIAQELYGREQKVYLTDAYYGYIRPSTAAKVRDLEVKYPQFLSQITTRDKTTPKPPLDDRSGREGEEIPLLILDREGSKSKTISEIAALDLSTVFKAFQAISEEIILEKLLDKLMQIVTKNARVQKGLLLLQVSDKLVLAAETSVELQKAVILPFTAIEECQDLPTSIINYVEKNREIVVLNNAIQEGLFSNDPYILKYQSKSVLGLPIVYQGKLTGILYLENREIRGAFTHDCLEFFYLLCPQISISIENANLYKNLQTCCQELEFKNRYRQHSELREQEKTILLETALQELQDTQLQLIQSEKLSNLGQMIAGIAHEINNPVNFININLYHASNYTQDLLNLIKLYQQNYPQPVNEIQDEIEAIDLEFLQEDLPKMLASLKFGAHSIKEIVRSLRNFSHPDTSQMTRHDIHEGIDTTLMILQHRLKAQPNRPAIEVIKEYGNLPVVECYASLLNQVFMNLLTNAIDAIEETIQNPKSVLESLQEKETLQAHQFAQRGETQRQSSTAGEPPPVQAPQATGSAFCKNQNFKIRICTEISDNRQVIIRIADNGSGMTAEVRSKLFNPFFTTKSIGKGTGIGLSISHQIVVEKHQGQIKCISAPGVGTEFFIELPIQQKI